VIDRADFQALVERAMQATGRAQMRPVVEKELLHYDLLFALDSAGLLDTLTFQGGTCLRLCYGSARYSEDLDFAGGKDFAAANLARMKGCLEAYVGSRYGLEVSVKQPAELAAESGRSNVKTNKWQIRVVTSPGRPDLPKQMIKIEVASVAAHTRTPRPLKRNYDFLPDGYGDTIVLCESLDEIMADKIVSLVDCKRYVRHRDIWDLPWLKQQGAQVRQDLVRSKVQDYAVRDFESNAEKMIERLPGIVHGKAFTDQMGRFIPIDVQDRTLMKEKFLTVLNNETVGILRQAIDAA